MSRTRPGTRRAAYAAAVAVAAGLVAAGCGAVSHLSDNEGNASTGKQLFVNSCGGCHVMKDAKTTGTVGPNLDNVFGTVRAQGFDISTIRDVVRGQIAYPETETAEGGPGMPANILVGQPAKDVSEYIAECAGAETCEAAG